eukprot:s1865_g23.t1
MEVCFLASGETLTVLDADEFEGKTAKAVKQTLAAKFGISRFKQRFFLQDGSGEIADDEVFGSAPPRVQLVVLELSSPDAEQREMLISASRSYDLAPLEKLLQYPLEPNEAGRGAFAPLHVAAGIGNAEAVRLLLEAQAQIDQCDSLGNTPLHIAAQEGQSDAVRLLVEAGALQDQETSDRATPLWLAASQGHLKTVRVLAELGADKEKATSDGVTPLFIATQQDHPDMISLLVELGADIDRAAKGGTTPLMVAAQQGYLRTLCLLLDLGAAKDQPGDDGATALFIAASRGHADIVRVLIASGADCDAALVLASHLRRVEVVQLLTTLRAKSPSSTV